MAVVMTVVGVLAVGVHASTAAAPLAVQTAAAADDGGGVPLPAIIAGALLAFAVGLAGGTAHRRRRASRPAATARSPAPEAESPAAAFAAPPAPPPQTEDEPAPPPAADEPAPPPDTDERTPPPDVDEPSWLEPGPSWVEPEPAEPHEPDADEAEAYEHYADEPAEVREVYEDDEVELTWEPGKAERPWPEAAELWSCQIDWKPGYRTSTFRAMAAAPGARKRRRIAESAPIRWTLMGDADPAVPEVVAALRDLIAAVEAAGWEPTEPGNDWFEQRFLWRREGEPGRVG